MSSKRGDNHSTIKSGLKPTYASDTLGCYLSIICGSVPGNFYLMIPSAFYAKVFGIHPLNLKPLVVKRARDGDNPCCT